MRSPISRFAYVQSDLGMKRSLFPRRQDHKTTMSAGLLYPIFVDEVLPGDTYSIDMSSLVRMSTPIHPVMDNLWLDTYWFFVPNRLAWDHWKEFMGESPEDPYINPIEYSVPFFTNGIGVDTVAKHVPPKSLLDYLGIPAGTVPRRFSQLQVRQFCLIWNNWFRDQNLQNAIAVDTGDNELAYSRIDSNGAIFWDNNNATNPDAYIINCAHGGDLPPVNKYHDYFTSALKEPQKGNPVPIPLSGFAPVYANNAVDSSPFYSDNVIITNKSGDLLPESQVLGVGTSSSQPSSLLNGSVSGFQSSSNVHFKNLGADLNNLAGVYSTINDLRYAFQLQKFLEADNRGGTRYREILKQHFGVSSPDASQQIPQFLGGKRIPIHISQVLQTSSTDTVSPQGNTAAYSLTTDKYSAFTSSFTEHGHIFCVACIRTEHTYSQGTEPMFTREGKFDFYFPEFANISEQPIYNREIFNGVYDTASWDLADQVFGFKEPWAEYRFKPNRVSAEFRPNYPQSLDVWHYADDYESQPYLSSEWIRETRSNVDRTLAVNDPTTDQFICDFYFKCDTTRVMPVTSIPGFADHH